MISIASSSVTLLAHDLIELLIKKPKPMETFRTPDFAAKQELPSFIAAHLYRAVLGSKFPCCNTPFLILSNNSAEVGGQMH
jgi:hypothetical protein